MEMQTQTQTQITAEKITELQKFRGKTVSSCISLIVPQNEQRV